MFDKKDIKKDTNRSVNSLSFIANEQEFYVEASISKNEELINIVPSVANPLHEKFIDYAGSNLKEEWPLEKLEEIRKSLLNQLPFFISYPTYRMVKDKPFL